MSTAATWQAGAACRAHLALDEASQLQAELRSGAAVGANELLGSVLVAKASTLDKHEAGLCLRRVDVQLKPA
jgi:hypothetical protein